ncbi:hypothetical protein QR680_008495 [Steinernema hermaphroditum]|uniref:Uncharacterized protein n=1 Tax=Steinernema hermaphroditum TaxID=289476 RepID=A0AA39IGS7_9BILA|nr:hypothetical protein QR680_008495 [Steinernema hermaphroditum]
MYITNGRIANPKNGIPCKNKWQGKSPKREFVATMGQKYSYELPKEPTVETARKASLDHCLGDATRMRSLSQDEKQEITVGTTIVTPDPMTEIELGENECEVKVKEKELVIHELFRTEPPEEFDLPDEMRPSQSHM